MATSPLYSHTVTISRQAPSSTFAQGGPQAFGGADPVSETVLASGVAASISYDRVGKIGRADLPTDARMSAWLISLPANAAVPLILEDDIVTDEIGKRYQIYAAQHTMLGYQLRAALLRA